MRALWKRLFVGPGFLSPKGLFLHAALILAAVGAAHLAGLRHYVTLMSGTPLSGAPPDLLSVGLAILYAGLYLAAAIVAPVLLIAAVVFVGLGSGLHITPREGAGPGPESDPCESPVAR